MKNLKPIDYIFTACLFLIGLTFIWRAFYGVNYNDEMYYADSLYRLFQGDVYLVHDWQLHLMSCIPVYPFYALFRLITGSNDGVILFLRILYVVFQLTGGSCMLSAALSFKMGRPPCQPPLSFIYALQHCVHVLQYHGARLCHADLRNPVGS